MLNQFSTDSFFVAGGYTGYLEKEIRALELVVAFSKDKVSLRENDTIMKKNQKIKTYFIILI